MDFDLGADHSDITFISQCNYNEDHVDRALRNLKEIQQKNESIRREMQMIKANPKQFVKSTRDEMVQKINQLRDQNDSLRRLVDKGKAPTYTEMTKKKIVHQHDASPCRESMNGSIRGRTPLEELDNQSHYDKNDGRSTCLNYERTSHVRLNRQYVVEGTDQQSREAITSEIRLLLKRADAFEEELARVNRKQTNELNKRQEMSEENRQQLGDISQYKKKLVRLLEKVRNREIAMSELVQTYRAMHQQTLQRLMQTTQNLEELRAAKISQDIDEKYAEVLQLQQRLQYINNQLEQLDESKWLQEICEQLTKAVRRMGVTVPKVEGKRELIDELCSILIEGHIITRKDGQNKVNMLKHYHEEEKKTNNRYIMSLKAKEQALGRKLIDIQMQK